MTLFLYHKLGELPGESMSDSCHGPRPCQGQFDKSPSTPETKLCRRMRCKLALMRQKVRRNMVHVTLVIGCMPVYVPAHLRFIRHDTDP